MVIYLDHERDSDLRVQGEVPGDSRGSIQDKEAHSHRAAWKAGSRGHPADSESGAQKLAGIHERNNGNRRRHNFPSHRSERMGGSARLNLLLDTHIWLWSLREPHLLGKRVQAELLDRGNQLWLSPVSVWEALVLRRKGKIILHQNLDKWLSEATVGFREAPLTHEIALAAESLMLHDDPADRFLAGTAKVLGLTLVTADQKLLGLGDVATLANR
jgi:PIN domain nuclease of toxin-antitoxin system